MGKLLEAVRTVHAAIKLRRGQCDNCRRILLDDAYRWCSDECHDEYQETRAI